MGTGYRDFREREGNQGNGGKRWERDGGNWELKGRKLELKGEMESLEWEELGGGTDRKQDL